MRQYTEARKRRSTPPPQPRPPRQRQRRRRTLAAALPALLTVAAACPTAGAAPAEAPAGVVLAEEAAPHYSLHLSADRRQWVAVFADAAELTLKLARGPLAAQQAEVSAVDAIDRIDVPPGINPYFGRHAYLQHDGVEHLFYSDQDLADARVTKWVYRDPAGAAPWMVDLLPEAILPVAALPAPAPADGAAEEPRFTLYGLVEAPAEEDAEDAGTALAAYDVLPGAAADGVAAAVTGRRVAATLSAAAAGQAVSGYGCAGRDGFAAADGAGLLLMEAARAPQRLAGAPPEAAAGGPAALGCGAHGTLLAYTRDDPRATGTSAGAALQAREVLAVPLDAAGARGTEIKVTLARGVGVLAVFPEPPLAAGGPPALAVLFSELAVDAAGAPEHRLALVTPEAGGGYRKQILAQAARPLQDLRALRSAEGALIVAFRSGGELRLLRTHLGSRGAGEAQRGASWRLAPAAAGDR